MIINVLVEKRRLGTAQIEVSDELMESFSDQKKNYWAHRLAREALEQGDLSVDWDKEMIPQVIDASLEREGTGDREQGTVKGSF